MKRFLTGLLLALVYVLPVAAASPEQELSPELRKEAEKYRAQKNEKNFTGWNGVLFYCHSPTSRNKHLKDICEHTYTNVQFLAATAKVKLSKANTPFEVGYGATVGDLLVLQVELFSTGSTGPTAVHANLRAYSSYSNAVEKSETAASKGSVPQSKPRIGDLVLWERTVTAASSSTAQELVVPVSQGIEHQLKQFFADYLNAQR